MARHHVGARCGVSAQGNPNRSWLRGTPVVEPRLPPSKVCRYNHAVAPTTDHFDGKRFFNPTGPPMQPFTKVARMLLERRTKWPDAVDSGQAIPVSRDDASALVTF